MYIVIASHLSAPFWIEEITCARGDRCRLSG